MCLIFYKVPSKFLNVYDFGMKMFAYHPIHSAKKLYYDRRDFRRPLGLKREVVLRGVAKKMRRLFC